MNNDKLKGNQNKIIIRKRGYKIEKFVHNGKIYLRIRQAPIQSEY